MPINEFIFGMDSQLYGQMEKLFEEDLPSIIKATIGNLTSAVDFPEDGMKALVEEIRKKFKAIEDEHITEYHSTFIKVIEVLRLSELSMAAENLLNLVILRGKLSSKPETVGGPIDVATISKSKGFHWIKQKCEMHA